MFKKTSPLIVVVLITAVIMLLGACNPTIASQNSTACDNRIPVYISGPSVLSGNTPMVWTVILPADLKNYMIRYTVTRGTANGGWDPSFSWDSTSPVCSFSAYTYFPATHRLEVEVTAPGYSPGSAWMYISTRYNNPQW